VQNTEQKPSLESLIDWCAFTVHDRKALEEVFSVIGISFQEFVQMPKGRLGYRNQQRCGHIVICSNGMPGMGIHVEMSGQGCRQFDETSGSWRDMIFKVFGVGGHFTRIDVAIDDRQGFIPLVEAKEKLLRREVRSRFKGGREITGVRFADNPGREGCTLYFGTPKSAIRIRIYDKAAEQAVDGVWIRTEVECRHEHANQLAWHLCNSDDQCAIVAGILKNYVVFVEPSIDSNKARWPVSPWWEDFLGSVQKLTLTKRKSDERTIQNVRNWVERNVATSLALLLEYEGGDTDFLVRLASQGKKRLKPHHFDMLARSRLVEPG
jgi:phage replication initiation protein